MQKSNTIEVATTLMNGCGKNYTCRDQNGYILGSNITCGNVQPYIPLCNECKSIIKAKRECWQEELKDNLALKEELKEKIQELFKGSQYFEGCRDWNILIIRYLDERIEEIQQALKITETAQ